MKITVGTGYDYSDIVTAYAAIPDPFDTAYLMEVHNGSWSYTPANTPPINLNKDTNGYKLNIRVVNGETATISANANGISQNTSSLIGIDSDNVTIDGLTISMSNYRLFQSIWIGESGAVDSDTIKNCSFTSTNPSSYTGCIRISNATNALIYNNTFSSLNSNSLSAIYADTNNLSDNIIMNNTITGSSLNYCLGIFGDEWIIKDNIIVVTTSKYVIRIGTKENITIHKNDLRYCNCDTGKDIIEILSTAEGTAQITKNTINLEGANTLIGISQESANISSTIKNNIIHNDDITANKTAISASVGTNTSDYNNIWQVKTGHTGVSAGTNDQVNTDNPDFYDSANRDYRLNEYSPCVGTAENGETRGALGIIYGAANMKWLCPTGGEKVNGALDVSIYATGTYFDYMAGVPIHPTLYFEQTAYPMSHQGSGVFTSTIRTNDYPNGTGMLRVIFPERAPAVVPRVVVHIDNPNYSRYSRGQYIGGHMGKSVGGSVKGVGGTTEFTGVYMNRALKPGSRRR